MTATSCIIKFGQNAIAIKDDSTFSTTSLLSIGNIDDLKNDTTALRAYATYEPDYWLLDGSYKFLPSTNIHAGYISAVMSPSNPASDFTVAPKIEILFSELHSTEQITLRFSELTGDWSDKISIGFFNGGSLINAAFYNPTSAEFVLNLTVENFNKIEIYFYSQNKAYRYARLNSIEFDETVIFSGSDIKSAELIEQISPVSIELPINTLEFTLFSDSGSFNVANPSGIYANLQNKEPIDVFESLDNTILYIGRFYLDKWESKSSNEAKFEASDAIALLDSFQYLGGIYGSPTIDSDDLIDEIFTAAGIEYNLSASISVKKVDGLIEYLGSCRNALQQVLFLIGGYATCSRSKIVNILPVPTIPGTPDHTITSSNKYINSPLILRPLVTGVEIKELTISNDLSPLNATLYSKTLGTGTHIIPLASKASLTPPSGIDLQGTATYTVTLSRRFYIVINVTVAGTVIIQEGEKTTIVDSIVGVYNSSLPSGTKQNIISIDNATLMTSATVTGTISTSTVATRVYDYYQHRFMQKTKLFASQVVVGDCVLIETQGQNLNGVVEKMVTDLSGGFLSDVEIIGDIV